MSLDPHDLVRQRIPGWRMGADISSEDTGVLVTVERFDPVERVLIERMVWIPIEGKPVDARLDELGYIVTADGFRW